jgi:hypothetical protein
MPFPQLVSQDTNLFSYCDFIEYCCFTDNEIPFKDFDINDSTFTLDDVKKELNRRLDLYSSFEPFIVKRKKVVSLLINKTDNLHYFYCLYFSLKGGTAQTSITNIFEKISDVCLKKYFDTTTSIITSIGQNNVLLRNAIEEIRLKLKESKGSDENIPKKAKDGGIDIITYKPIDSRGNQVICLTDATIGKNWRSDKMVQHQLQSWTEFVHFKITPITCLTIIHIIEPENFHGSSKANGLLFDRTRIMKYYTVDSSITNDLNLWHSTL